MTNLKGNSLFDDESILGIRYDPEHIFYCDHCMTKYLKMSLNKDQNINELCE
jgi:hypothetical protein